MKSEIIKASDYELDEVKAKEVCVSFAPAIEKKLSMIPDYENILTMDINADTCKKAGDLRKKLVKVRTQGIEATRKAQKNFALRFGQFVDAFAKKETVHIQLMESNLSDIEKHYENLEKERIAKLIADRESELAPYTEAMPSGLGEMDQETFENLKTGFKTAHLERLAEQQRIEEERVAKEKAEAEERERIRKENERLKAEAIEREKKEAAERAERDRIEQERLAKEAEERQKIEEKARKEREAIQAKLEEERKERNRIEAEKSKIIAERKAKEEAELAAREEEEKRNADKEHRRKINSKAVMDLVECGVSETAAKAAIRAIANGKIKSVIIKY